MDTAIVEKTGRQILASSERSRVGARQERLLRPRVIAVLLLVLLGLAAALASVPDRESELGAPTAAYESARFVSAN